MDFRDRDGAPLIKWHDAESAFEAWKACSARPSLRLHRHDLRPPARRQRHPVAVHRRRAGRHRATLRRRALQHRPRLLRDVRPGPHDRSCAGRGVVSRQGAAWPGVPARRRVRAVSRGPGRRVSVAAHDRAHAVPLPHAHQDRPYAGTPGGGSGGVGRDESGRREGFGAPRGRPRLRRVAPRRGAGPCPRLGHPRGRRVRPVPLRRLGS